MKIVAYLGFTLFSIFIQFSVMDFIQGMLKLDEKPTDLKRFSQKRQLRDVLKDITYKPHALYYRTQNIKKEIKKYSPAKFFSNSTMTELFATTDITTAVFDILYDENTTVTEETYTTESLYTGTDIDNVTEITFFEKSNKTVTKTDAVPKKSVSKDCSCNFFVKVCDINCCCDSDCLESEKELFPNCISNKNMTNKENDQCLSQLAYFGYGNGLFCIVKVNLPAKRHVVYQKTYQAPTEPFLTWKSNGKSHNLYEYSNTIYKYGDPLWILKNGSIYHSDLPSPTVNNYCSGRKAIQFLKDEKYRCNVKLRDLEMLHITKSLEEVAVISATPLSINSSVLNCTSLHCVNWTVYICIKLVCTNYSQTLHEPACTEIICTNIALKIRYTFYYQESRIINATIQFHVENITMDLPFMSQEIEVNFVLTNKSLDDVLKLSGNPGYLDGLPIIVSEAEKNFTDTFFNNTMQVKRGFLLPENHKGECIPSNSSGNFLLFGKNKRIKCRYNHMYIHRSNATEECNNIQNNIHRLVSPNKLFVSPLGNPQQLPDIDWVLMENNSFEGTLYGKEQDSSSKLRCFNVVTRFSMIFSFALINGHNRILSCRYVTTAKNVTFNTEDISTVVTIDISFVDVEQPSVIEYATGKPNLNIHLPDDFFYPFRSTQSRVESNLISLILLITIVSCK